MGLETANNTNNQLTVKYDTSKIFIGDNRHDKFTAGIENSTYDDVTYLAGTVFGQKSADLSVKPLTSGASDGSQFPLGILAHDITVEASSTYEEEVTLCVEGRVAEDKVLFQGSDDLETIVSSRTLRARIGADTVGIKLVESTEMTGYDNV